MLHAVFTAVIADAVMLERALDALMCTLSWCCEVGAGPLLGGRGAGGGGWAVAPRALHDYNDSSMSTSQLDYS
eukprot:2936265-Prymnesium_polylepis.1